MAKIASRNSKIGDDLTTKKPKVPSDKDAKDESKTQENPTDFQTESLHNEANTRQSLHIYYHYKWIESK